MEFGITFDFLRKLGLFWRLVDKMRHGSNYDTVLTVLLCGSRALEICGRCVGTYPCARAENWNSCKTGIPCKDVNTSNN